MSSISEPSVNKKEVKDNKYHLQYPNNPDNLEWTEEYTYKLELYVETLVNDPLIKLHSDFNNLLNNEDARVEISFRRDVLVEIVDNLNEEELSSDDLHKIKLIQQ